MKIQSITSTTNNIERVFPMSGGSTSKSYCVLTKLGAFFIKVNSNVSFPNMFQREYEALELLINTTPIKIPRPILFDSVNDNAFIIMEFIKEGKETGTFWENFGSGVANLHQNTSSNGFGFTSNNYVGSLTQKNNWKENWLDLFIEERLMVQERLAIERGLIDKSTSRLLYTLYTKLDDIFPEEKSSLLHGDLWSGNFMVSNDGKPVIIDPAVYYGHREMDIAMSHLFGGFDKRFYDSYNKVYPLETGWEKRIEICNLYPLLIHVNLFGENYANRVKAILKRLV